jgi:hypothetical protein
MSRESPGFDALIGYRGPHDELASDLDQALVPEKREARPSGRDPCGTRIAAGLPIQNLPASLVARETTPARQERRARCHSCGGAVELRGGPGRFHTYRGVRCEVPENLEIDTCTVCGNSWLSSEEIRILSRSFERQRLSRERTPAEERRLRFVTLTEGVTAGPGARPEPAAPSGGIADGLRETRLNVERLRRREPHT